MVKAIAKANMLDSEHMVAHCFDADLESRKDAITDAGDRIRAGISSRMNVSSECEHSGRAVA